MFAGRQNRQTSANTRICERRKCVWQAAERCQSHVNIHIKNPYQVISAGHENTNIYILFLLFVFLSPMHNKFMYNKNVSSFVQPLFIQWCVKCNKRMWRDTTPKNISISYIYMLRYKLSQRRTTRTYSRIGCDLRTANECLLAWCHDSCWKFVCFHPIIMHSAHTHILRYAQTHTIGKTASVSGTFIDVDCQFLPQVVSHSMLRLRARLPFSIFHMNYSGFPVSVSLHAILWMKSQRGIRHALPMRLHSGTSMIFFFCSVFAMHISVDDSQCTKAVHVHVMGKRRWLCICGMHDGWR